MKKFTLALFGFIMMNLEAPPVLAQQKWVATLELFNKLKVGGTTPKAITFMDKYNDTLTIGGWVHDSIYVLDQNGQIKKFYNIENLFQRINGTWQQLQTAPMKDLGAVLIAHPPPIYGIQYLSEEVSPVANVLNRATNQFDSLKGIGFNGYFHYMAEMGNGEVLIIGSAYPGSFSVVNGQVYRSAVLYDAKTLAVRHTYCSIGEGTPSYADAEFESHDTVFIVGRNSNGDLAISGIKKGTTQWLENIYPTVYCTKVLRVVHSNGVTYAVIQNKSYQDQLYRFSNGTWQKLIDFELNASVSNDPIKAIVLYKGKLLVAGEFAKANDIAVNGLISYNEATKAIAEVAELPSSSITNCLGLYSIDDTLYMPWYRGSYLNGLQSQTLYVLKDAAITPPPNKAPVANAGTDQTITLPTNTVTLTGSGTDADGTIKSYAWSKVSGPTATIASPSSATTTVSGFTEGTFNFELNVTDDKGAIGKDTVVITVHPAPPLPNVPPTAHAGTDQTITLPTNTVTLTGSGTDVDGTIKDFAWSKVSGSGTIESPSNATTVVSNLDEETSVFRLTVTDNDGATATDDISINVIKTHVDTVIASHRIYPNPATDKVTIEQAREITAIVAINGTQIQICAPKHEEVGMTFSVSSYPSGIYVIKSQDLDKKVFIKKLVVIH